ncbi:MAG: DUF202 domain-containing protein [Salinigranum sp.]
MDEADSSTEKRDLLAEERTRLSRERTTLAYIRTGFSAFLFGVAVEQLYGSQLTTVVGAAFIAIGALVLTSGAISYVWSRRRTRQFVQAVEQTLNHE